MHRSAANTRWPVERSTYNNDPYMDTSASEQPSGGKQGTKTSFLEINVVGDVLEHAMEYVLPNRTRYL